MIRIENNRAIDENNFSVPAVIQEDGEVDIFASEELLKQVKLDYKKKSTSEQFALTRNIQKCDVVPQELDGIIVNYFEDHNNSIEYFTGHIEKIKSFCETNNITYPLSKRNEKYVYGLGIIFENDIPVSIKVYMVID